MKTIASLLQLLLCVCLAAPCAAAGLEQASGEIRALVLDNAAFRLEKGSGGRRVLEIYARIEAGLNKDALKSVADAELRSLAESMAYVGLFRSDESFALAFERVFAELEARGLAERESAGYLQLAYIDARMFDRAKEMFEKYPQYGLNLIPEIEEPSNLEPRRRAYAMDNEEARIRAVSLSRLDKGAKVLLIGSVFCNFCKEAVSFLEGSGLLAASSGSLSALSSNFAPKELAEWNSFGRVTYMIPYNRGDWSEFDLGSTPNFYFLRNGRQVYNVRGWGIASGGRIAEGFFSLGLIDIDAYVAALRHAADLAASSGESFEERSAAALEFYSLLAPHVRKSALRKASPQTLEKIFYLAADALVKGAAAEPLAEITETFRELERRGTVKKEIVENLYDYYLDLREFGAAKALVKKYPAYRYAPVPELLDGPKSGGSAHRVYDVSSDGRKAALSALDIFGEGPRVVVSGVPGCGATKRAFKDIEADPELKTIFEKYGVFITWNSYFGSVASWNKVHATKAYVAYLRSDWPELNIYSSPVFYFFRDGKLITSARGGWGNREEMAERLKGLGDIGLNH